MNATLGHTEVIELTMSGEGQYIDTSGITLFYKSIGPISCYFGADNGANKIVMLCAYHSSNHDGLLSSTPNSLSQTLTNLTYQPYLPTLLTNLNSTIASYTDAEGLLKFLCDDLIPENAKNATQAQCKQNLLEAMNAD